MLNFIWQRYQFFSPAITENKICVIELGHFWYCESENKFFLKSNINKIDIGGAWVERVNTIF